VSPASGSHGQFPTRPEVPFRAQETLASSNDAGWASPAHITFAADRRPQTAGTGSGEGCQRTPNRRSSALQGAPNDAQNDDLRYPVRSAERHIRCGRGPQARPPSGGLGPAAPGMGRGTIPTRLVRGVHHGAHELTPTPNSDLVKDRFEMVLHCVRADGQVRHDLSSCSPL